MNAKKKPRGLPLGIVRAAVLIAIGVAQVTTLIVNLLIRLHVLK